VDSNAISEGRKVTDGYYDVCSTQKDPVPDPYVRVALENEFYVSEVVITFKNYSKYWVAPLV